MRNVLLTSAVLGSLSAYVGAAITFNGTPFTENFDGVPASSISNFFVNAGTLTPITGTTFDGARLGGTSTDTHMAFQAGYGQSNTGSISSYGTQVGETSSFGSERAFGSFAGTAAHQQGYGVQIINNASKPLASLTITFVQETYRYGGVPDVTNAQWATSATLGTPADNYLKATGFTDEDSLDLVPPTGLTAVDQRLDGNLPANQSTRSHTFVFAGDGLAVGDSFYLRFIDWNNTGTDSAMAIDNFTVTGTLVPEPTSAGMVALGLLSGGLIRRRRRA